MAVFDNQIMSVFSWDICRQIAGGEQIPLYKLNIFTAMLANNCIPYELSYSPGSRKEAPAYQLTIHINPTATLVFTIALASGATAFTPSP
ncbi:MAG: hypothetical protein FWC55_07575 [Firmicutes bacterium]|nr:hypothetical protein [Bacillota bacterium]